MTPQRLRATALLNSACYGYIELYRNRELAVFQYEADKSSDAVVSKLRPFHGTLTADAEHRFNAVFASGRVTESGCNAHGRRKSRDAEETQPLLAVEGGEFIGAMYGEEEKAQPLGLTGPELLEHRQRFIRLIADDFQRWLAAVERNFRAWPSFASTCFLPGAPRGHIARVSYLVSRQHAAQ